MEQEKHLTEQETRKPVTKATARHLRRKRLKDARRAEERQYLDILNGVSSHIKDEEANGTTKNSADISDKSSLTSQQAALELASAGLDKSVFSHSSVNLSLSDPLNDLTIAAILKKLASLESSHAATNLPPSYCSSNVVDEAKSVNGAEDNLSQTTNGKKKRKKRKKCAKSSTVGATLDEDLQNTSSSNSESSVSNLNCDSNCSASRLDSDSVGNGQILRQNVLVNVADHSMQRDIETESIDIKNDQVEMSTTNHCVNHLSANTVNGGSITGTSSGQSDSGAESKGEETNASSLASPTASTAEETFHSSTKTREKMSAQHGANKAAKMKASKVAGSTNRNKSSTADDKSLGKGTETETVKDVVASKTDVVADSQSSQSARRTKNSKQNSIQNDSSATSKSEKSNGSPQKPVSSTKKANVKASIPEKTKEEVKAQRQAKKAAKMKAKSKKAAESTGTDNNDVQHESATADCTSPSKSAETKILGDVARDLRKATVVDDTQSSQSARESEPKQNAEENDIQSGLIATSGNEKSDYCAQESISSIKMINEESSLPEKTKPVTDSQNSQPVKEIESKQITGGNDIQSDPATVFKSEELSASPPSIKMADNKSSLPEKTREEVKAEREAKKAAKAAAKAKAKGKKTGETTDDVETEHEVSIGSVTTKPVVTDVQSSQETNVVVTSLQSPQPAREAEKSSKETQHPLTVQPANVESSAVSRQDSAISDEKSEGKSKAELRAERRAKQEAQRAAKQLQQSAAKQQETSTKQQPPSTSQQLSSAKSGVRSQEAPLVKPQQAAGETASAKRVVKRDNDHEVNLFKHLYNERELSLDSVPVNSNIHPAIIGLGAQYAGRTIVGSNARCVALLAAVKQVIQDFVKPEQADFTRSLEVCLRDLLAYLHRCRPVAVSMQNAMRHLKWHMTTFPITISTDEAKSKLTGIIDTYITEQIELAGKAISITIQTKISNGDIILIYGFSSLICNILVDAHAADKKFRVIVVDGRPWLEGREQLRRLVKHGIDCSYMYINAVSFIMPEVSKVFLSAHTILANGAVMSRVGTSQIALIAKAFNVPVLVACETHKTCGRVQTDSIVYNELGNADDLVNSHRSSKKSLLTNWRARKSLNLLNITYDVTPADLITAVVTELAILPCTSVPVILRIKPSEF
ncbi:translation initiation factor eIF-2B subunit delta isoform X2 [Odontomachus brunneus]|uniref:translation initiation factor eIF-2B subunit delta isoform X2 n=1 Tax=Odontomachus brunneus TaxID=486640 RepID=UPI0013F1FC02|nr:translation initiation factor eIF-2B subunit delta isoform X2 [Odontomachus brunneus]XP_032685907.1 translation initiation factor eIF-2B subunit delta isoform X2 [Odontomachus brunneus]